MAGFPSLLIVLAVIQIFFVVILGTTSPFYVYNASLGNFTSQFLSMPAGSRSMEPDFYTNRRFYEKLSWPGFAGIDFFILTALKDKSDGYFVDVSSQHWKANSNTYVMDQFNSWQGICIEADRAFLTDLLANRRCKIFADHVGSQNGSSTTSFVPLADILDFANAPAHIDFISLIHSDAGNALANFPFHKYTFLFLAIARPTHETHILLAKHRYFYLLEASAEGILIYLHQSAPNFEDLVLRERSAARVPSWLGTPRPYLLHPHPLQLHSQYTKDNQCKYEEVPLTPADYHKMKLWSSFYERDPKAEAILAHADDTIFGFDTLIREVYAH